MDTMTVGGAQRLALRIREYWAERGHVVQTTIRPNTVGKGVVWVVRSDMLGGRPKQ